MWAASWVLLSAASGNEEYHLWMLDEGQGNIAINSGTQSVDLEIATPRWTNSGPFEMPALRLDGTGSSHARFEGEISNPTGTLEMWVRPHKLTDQQMIFCTGYPSTTRALERVDFKHPLDQSGPVRSCSAQWPFAADRASSTCRRSIFYSSRSSAKTFRCQTLNSRFGSLGGRQMNVPSGR
jgi:hypothetical protein